jgi:hypothetical protein
MHLMLQLNTLMKTHMSVNRCYDIQLQRAPLIQQTLQFTG